MLKMRKIMTTRRQLTKLIDQRESKELPNDKILRALQDYWDLMEELDFVFDNIDEQTAELRYLIKND